MNQACAIDILKTGGNVFLTGEPGAGKTHVINQYITWLEAAGVSVAVTASTGIAATHVGGMTIHAWSGIGARDSLSAHDIEQIATREKTAKRIRKAHVLVIDEISMLDGSLLDNVDQVCRTVRNRQEPFGGLQVIFVGDFFQLPPIAKRGSEMRYAFESRAWDSAKLIICYLTEQFRQDDEMLLGLLQSIRKNEIDEDHYTLLQEQTDIGYEDIEPTRLYTHNADVDAVNSTQLAALAGKQATFTMSGRGGRQYIEALTRTCLSPESLVLKEEAMVMCTKNNFEAGYVNGTLGRVVRFEGEEGYPVIKTADGREITITPMSWSVSEDGKVLAEITQVPLRLAWAITVHKSQGMSLDAAEIDLSRAFVYGQGYVALSRVRTLIGLRTLGMNANALMVDPKIVARDNEFQRQSSAAEDTFADMDTEEVEKLHHQFVTACGGSMPTADDLKGQTKKPVRNQTERTADVTKRLLHEKKDIEGIARERGLVASTIWNHIEQLIQERAISAGDIDHLLPENWQSVWEPIQNAIETVGHEKLKPIYEHLEEAYDYPTIRLARAYYYALQNDAAKK